MSSLLDMDPNILVSMVNMKLRDFYSNLDQYCEDVDINMYVNLIAARTEDKDNEIYKKIVDAYHSPEVEKVYAEDFKGAYIAVWWIEIFIIII